MSEIKLFKRQERKQIFLRTFDPEKVNEPSNIKVSQSDIELAREWKLGVIQDVINTLGIPRKHLGNPRT